VFANHSNQPECRICRILEIGYPTHIPQQALEKSARIPLLGLYSRVPNPSTPPNEVFLMRHHYPNDVFGAGGFEGVGSFGQGTAGCQDIVK
jgi:hypothetical protein